MQHRITQIIWYLLSVLEIVLLFRFLLKLLGASTTASFTDFIYTISQPFVSPFLRVFRVTSVDAVSVIEWTTVLAMVVYWIIAMILVQLVLMNNRPVSQ